MLVQEENEASTKLVAGVKENPLQYTLDMAILKRIYWISNVKDTFYFICLKVWALLGVRPSIVTNKNHKNLCFRG